MASSSTHLSQTTSTLDRTPGPKDDNENTNLRESSQDQSPPDTEVEALSNKLIHAINHQTDLDDSLSVARQNVSAAHSRIVELESQVREHKFLVQNNYLITREDAEKDLSTQLADERQKRTELERSKQGLEQELEGLTTALFEEANQMVIEARKQSLEEQEILTKRNDQLQAQLADTKTLLASHQEQLVELKHSLQLMTATNSDAPSPRVITKTALSPHVSSANNPLSPPQHLPPIATDFSQGDSDSAPPLSFTGLLSPVLRSDTIAYDEFRNLFENTRRSAPSSRVNSGSYAGLGLAQLSKLESVQSVVRLSSGNSTSGTHLSFGQRSMPKPPSTPVSPTSAAFARDLLPPAIALKDTPFYKRVLVEDIEPTIRLDAAPGLSWLAKRGLITNMTEGKLIVEPVSMSGKMVEASCALCGEHGSEDVHLRKHQFRINENENASAYPLCRYCLERLRSTCDFLGFLRLIRDGFWKAEGPLAEVSAWHESVKHRERMFWARIGGGVKPAPHDEHSATDGSYSKAACVQSTAADPPSNPEIKRLSREQSHDSSEHEDGVSGPSETGRQTQKDKYVSALGITIQPGSQDSNMRDKASLVVAITNAESKDKVNNGQDDGKSKSEGPSSEIEGQDDDGLTLKNVVKSKGRPSLSLQGSNMKKSENQTMSVAERVSIFQ